MIDIVIDEGSSQVKAVWIENGETRHQVVLSDVIPRAVSQNGGLSESSWSIGREEFTVDSSMAGRIRTNVTGYQVSNANRVLIHETLRRIGMSGQDVSVSVTLPVGEFFRHDMRPNSDRITQKKENVLGEIKNLSGVDSARVVKCLVQPEAIPAFYDHVMNDKGEIINSVRRALIVDFGGTTVDLSILNGTTGGLERFDSIRLGVFNIKQELAGMLRDRFKVARISDDTITQALSSGMFDDMPISQEIDDAYRNVSNAVLNDMLDFEPESREFDLILYVGGGSAMVGERIAKQYGGRYQIPTEPHLAIAKGIMKMKLSRG